MSNHLTLLYSIKKKAGNIPAFFLLKTITLLYLAQDDFKRATEGSSVFDTSTYPSL